MIICYLVVLIIALLFAIKLLAPEISNPVSSVPLGASPQTDNNTLKQTDQDTLKQADDNALKQPDDNSKIEKLEMMLVEKNKNIQHLQEELKILQAQSQDFEKIKTLLEEEIQHLKEQNRIMKPGVSSDQSKENLIM